MSFTKEKREHIKRYILEKIDDGNGDFVNKAASAFDISLNTVYRYVRELERDGIIEKKDNKYRLSQETGFFILHRKKGELESEDTIYDNCIDKYMKNLPDNTKRIWQYSFMEMMNNAIDHSESEVVFIVIIKSILTTTILIIDSGVGIFRKIKEYYHYNTLDDAVNELFKGKLTTDSENHSGEGIFFTSRILDRFAAISDGKIFTHDKYSEKLRNLEDIMDSKNRTDKISTIIYMELSNFSKKNLKEVFDMFSDVDGGFTKTHIPVKNIYETYPVSRSQAKRLCNRFDKFQEIELDFDGISDVGQGFAHEIFYVFQNKHPNVKIIPVNMTKDVEKMINHVKNTNV